jgi:hypothetical protein
LQSIAQGAYGDAALWYLIADANGLGISSSLQAGTMLTLPSTVGTVHNNTSTFKPYEAGRMIGNTSPTVPTPDGSKCATIGFTILSILAAVVVSVLVTVVTGGAGAGLGAALIAGVVGGALGSVASQGVMMLARQQQDFSWSDVAVGVATGLVGAGMGRAATAIGKSLSAASKMVGAGLGRSTSLATRAMAGLGNIANGASKSARALQLVGRAASETVQNVVGDAVGQGVSILVGKQESFDWKSIAFSAASGAGAGLGTKLGGLGEAVGGIAGSGLTNLAVNGRDFDMNSFISDATSSVIGGMSSFLADRGKNSNPNGYKIAITDRSPETAKSVRAYLMKHPEAEIINVKNLMDAAKVHTNDKLLVVGHNNGTASSMVLGRFLKKMENAPAKISLVMCNAASDVNGAMLLQQTVAITGGRSTVSAHTGKIRLGSEGQRIVNSAGSRKLTYHNDGSYTSSASKNVEAMDGGWLGNPLKRKADENATIDSEQPSRQPRSEPERDMDIAATRSLTRRNSAPASMFADHSWAVVASYSTGRRLAVPHLTPDHVPSAAAVRRFHEIVPGERIPGGRNIGLGGQIAREGSPAVMVDGSIHNRHSRTFAGRNHVNRIESDAYNLASAVRSDIAAYRDSVQLRRRASFDRIVNQLDDVNISNGLYAHDDIASYNLAHRRRNSN